MRGILKEIGIYISATVLGPVTVHKSEIKIAYAGNLLVTASITARYRIKPAPKVSIFMSSILAQSNYIVPSLGDMIIT